MKTSLKSLVSIYSAFLLITTIIYLGGCEPKVIFEQAMPPDVVPIGSIPDKFQGVYECESDGSRMYADKFKVYRESYFKFTTTVDHVRDTEDCSILAGGLYLPGRNECIPFEYIGEDTITAKVYDLDTLFHFAPNQIAKEYKGRLFLNMSDDSGKWITFMISPNSDGSMLWELIDIPNKLKDVTEITYNFETKKNRKDETIYILDPTMVEFDRIINDKDYMLECDVLKPINLEDGYSFENRY